MTFITSAISELANNTTVFHYKTICLVLLCGILMIGLRLRFGTARRSPPSASPESAGGAAAASDAIWFHNFYCSNTAWVKQVVRFVEENKQLLPLNLLTLQSKTSQMEQYHGVFLPCLLCCSPLEWFRWQHQTQLDRLRSEQGAFGSLRFIHLAMSAVPCNAHPHWLLKESLLYWLDQITSPAKPGAWQGTPYK